MPANLIVEDPSDPIVTHLPRVWARTDEWYTFDRRPEDNPRLKVLLRLDEASAHPSYPGPDLPAAIAVGHHPLTWRQELGATRSFYTALGHTDESWSEEGFVAMVVKAIEWAARRAP
jgi:type 1 glutamine amidotransferase